MPDITVNRPVLTEEEKEVRVAELERYLGWVVMEMQKKSQDEDDN